MENLFITVQALIAENMPELSLVDEDYGQLQALFNGEDHYPVTFPCVLIGDFKAKWTNTTPQTQQGTFTFTVRLAFDCYHDTHYGSGTEDKIRERLELDNKLYGLLQGFRPHKQMKPLRRLENTHFSLPHGIKVYETIYGSELVDQSAVTPL